jgi:hypothetical protein
VNTATVQADLSHAAATHITPVAPVTHGSTANILKRVSIAGTVIALVGVLWFLYAKTQAANFSREDNIIANLRALEVLDAEWIANMPPDKHQGSVLSHRAQN